jgi:hypothetical protein
MKRVCLAGVLAVMLAGCGGTGADRAAIVEACVSDGSGQESCECMAKAAEEDLSGEHFAKLGKAARAGEDGMDEMFDNLSAEEQAAFMGFAMKAGMSCGLS